MEHNERDIAYEFGAGQRRNNATRSETTLISEMVYSRPGDYYLRRIMLGAYDDQSDTLAAEMS